MRFLVASAAHAARLFPGPGNAHICAVVVEALARAGGALVVAADGSAMETITEIANGAEIADALGSLDGVVTFLLRNDPAPPGEPTIDCGPPSRDPSLAEVEVENARLRKVEAAARALLAAMWPCSQDGCGRTAVQEATADGDFFCDTHGSRGLGILDPLPQADAIRALEALLVPAVEEPSS